MFKSNREHKFGLGQRKIIQILASYFVENADFITIHAGFMPFAQSEQKGD